jgi:hypothetical protein
MKYEFCFLEKEKLKEEEIKFRKGIEIVKHINEFLLELEELGHKKITIRIEELARKFFEEKNIEVENIFYQNLDKKYNGISEKYFDRTLIINFKDYYGIYENIEIMRGYENNVKGGFYDNLLEELNPYLKKENIEEIENKRNEEFSNAYKNIDLYNEKLKELIELRNSFGYLAR